MRRRSVLLLLALLFACTLHAGLARAGRAQGSYFEWDYINVDITIRSNGDLDIVETQRYIFCCGRFTFAYREIPLLHLTAIDRVWVEWLGHPEGLRQVSTERKDGSLRITWYFPPTEDSAEIFRVHYTVHGATRIYEAGDEIWWEAIGSERDREVGSSRVTVHLPAPVARDDLVVAAYGVAVKSNTVDARTITFRAGTLSSSQELEVRVRFPHGLVHATPPPWQTALDRQVAYAQNVRPGVTLLTVIFSISFLIVTNLGMLLWRYLHRRDAPALVASYLTEPPADLAPGPAGILVDQAASIRGVVATLVDLARRGVIAIRETGTIIHMGSQQSRDFVFGLLEPSTQLRPYEARVISFFFVAGRRQRRLSELINKFYLVLPDVLRLMRDETITAGLFPRNPETAHSNAIGGGCLIALLGVVAATVCAVLFSAYTGAACAPGLALAAAGLSFAIHLGDTPQWTAQGAEQAARWRAFKRYLKEIEKYTDLAAAKEIFERYLPYAIAFGLDRGWTRKFAAVDAPVPGWYTPYGFALVGGVAGSVSLGAGLAPHLGRLAVPSLGGVGTSLAGSLQAMSAGLLDMVNSASTVLSSAPVSAAGLSRGWRLLLRVVSAASGGGGGGAG